MKLSVHKPYNKTFLVGLILMMGVFMLSFSSATNLTKAHGVTIFQDDTVSTYFGLSFMYVGADNYNIFSTKAVTGAGCDYAKLYWENGTVIETSRLTSSSTGGYMTFIGTHLFKPNTVYRVECTTPSLDRKYNDTATFPKTVNSMSWVGCSALGANCSTWNNIESINISLTGTVIALNLLSPANDSRLTDTGSNFTAQFNITGDNSYSYVWKNATIYLWNSTGIFNQTIYTLSGANYIFHNFIDDFNIGSYSWNIRGWYGNDSYSNFTWAINNYSYIVGASLTNVIYNSNIYETSNQRFSGNLSLLNGTSLYDVKLVYNGTEYSGSLVNLGGNVYSAYSYIDIPAVVSTINKSFFFKLIYSIGSGIFLYENTTSYNQTVNLLNLSYCNSITNQTLNFTLNNEENLTSLGTWNFLGTFEYWIGLGNTKKNVSINQLNIDSASICINPSWNITYYSNAIIQYEKTGFIKRNYYLYNASLTNTTQNITLYALDSAVGTAFIISVKDGSQLPISDAYIYVQRYYPGTGLFQTVSMSKTDGNGNTVAYFETQTEDYRIMVQKDGVIVYTSPIQKVYCSATPCTLPIQTSSAGVLGWSHIGNLSNLIYSGPSYDSITKLISYTYIDTSGTTHYGRLFVYTINSGIGKQTICDINSTSNAATLVCDVTNITGTVYAEGYISRSPEILVWGVSFIINTVKSIMGLEGLFWAFIIIALFAIGGVLMGGVSGGIIGVIISFIGTAWLGIASFGAVTVWGIIILGIFIIWQIKS